DVRRSSSYDGMTDVSGINAGFLVGQQFDASGAALEDRKGNMLSFTSGVSLTEKGDDLEVTGIRVIKYPIDYNSGDNADNDYVYYRLADLMLMKAEAALRSGDSGTALSIVNEIRAKRGAAALASLDLDGLLAERGRELYWEGHRRTDLLRFGKFLDAWQEKPASGSERLLFPIPAPSLASNPNLTQNPGYGN
ncbi:MAG: RagB/SusD family nutrient uptake outer membrane protein, partial [Bacteroidota bacterium]